MDSCSHNSCAFTFDGAVMFPLMLLLTFAMIFMSADAGSGYRPYEGVSSFNPKCVIVVRDFNRFETDEAFINYAIEVARGYGCKNVEYIKFEWADNPKLGFFGKYIVNAIIFL